MKNPVHSPKFLTVLLHLLLLCACDSQKESTSPQHAEERKLADPALQNAIQLRDDVLKTTRKSLSYNKPLDDEGFLAMWKEIDIHSKRTNLKLWAYVMAKRMGLSQREIDKEFNKIEDDTTIDEAWDDAIQYQLVEYRKKIKKLQRELSSPKAQEKTKDLPQELTRQEGPFVVGDRAYSLVFPKVNDGDDSYTRMYARHPLLFDEYRRQDDGTWKRVDWQTLNEVTRHLRFPATFKTELDKPHVTDSDIIALDPSFQNALRTWQNLIEHPEKIDPESFIKHCDPEAMAAAKKSFLELYHYSALLDNKSDFDHLFTWSDIYESKFKQLDTKGFWEDYLNYCKDHIEGKFFDEEDDYAYSDILLQVIPSRKEHTIYERYLQSGSKTNILISNLFLPVTHVKIHDLAPVHSDTIHVIYRTRTEDTLYGGLHREIFARVNGHWKFRRQQMSDLLRFRALDKKEQYERKKKSNSDKDPTGE